MERYEVFGTVENRCGHSGRCVAWRGAAAALAVGAALLLLPSCGRNGMKVQKAAIQNTGSDTMVNLAQMWSEAYGNVDATVSVEVAGGGSGVGIANLINGTVDIANASRDMTESEKQEAKQKTGKDVVEFLVGYDALAVYVHKDNPIEQMTLEELAGVYGEKGAVEKWAQLGIDHKNGCPSDEIIRVSRMSNSGTYVYFREHVLKKADYKQGSRDMPGSKEVVELVGRTPCAIGYSGMGYKTDAVKFVKVAAKKGDPAYAPSIEAVRDKEYPLARALYMYTLGQPAGATKKYLDWVMSPAGQKIVEECGYIPYGVIHGAPAEKK
jgi:phosphate transport system substrate-binding protein